MIYYYLAYEKKCLVSTAIYVGAVCAEGGYDPITVDEHVMFRVNFQ